MHLKRCPYFEHLYQDAATVGNELQKLFCGFDGYEVMVSKICQKFAITTKK